VSAPAAGTTVVTNALSAEFVGLFDLAYATCLRLLARLFFETSDADGFGALQHLAFFPMMTLVLRPLGDMLTTLPAFDDAQPERAGPSFQMPSSAAALPHASVSWQVLLGQLTELRDRVAALAARADLPVAIAPRVAFLAENTWRIVRNFEERADLGVTT
jgi:hypothetical protein